ncbi:FG-GAP-like repeat-containing protein [uncultured Nocardioides sp.]|uniref:FG-GAP-like repeat-containing protein n=1 Tax=uncultured Nocardioides sp. TaxID=198441 RepID=UPI002633B284|nr:FG-GAP-like repeat-containing protein [uncultured Nocardioides sp.]
MRPSQARFVTVCQQLLALAVVLVVLAPAAGIATLDVVDRMPDEPGTVGDARVLMDPAAYRVEDAEVETAPVEPIVVEHQLTADTSAAQRSEPGRSARSTPSALAGGRLLSKAEPVTGYGAVGVTWGDAEEVGEDGIAVSVRTRTGDGAWSRWDDVEYHDDHAPDPGSAEARRSRPGTEPTFVGEVDEVQVRAETDEGAMPADMRLAVVGPGESRGTDTEAPAYGAEPAEAATQESSEGDLALSAAAGAARPTIFSRAQWGADERLRSGSPSYGSVKGGFVHHTVNANDYSPDQVPGMLRSIYAYHTQSRGWSDVGYNFLVDKFGRIWEGRYGGVTRAVIGAHTLGYNHESFAMSAIGNFETATAPDAMVRAYGALMGWKLGIHGVDAGAGATIAGRRFASAINGHRDAGSTACPGRYLYDRLGAIRSLAKAAQNGNGGEQPPTEPPTEPPVEVSGTPDLDSNLVGTRHPDLAVRRASDNRLLLLRTAGGTKFTTARPVTRSVPASAQVFASPDLTGDGVADLVAVDGGRAAIHPGAGDGTFGAPVREAKGFAGMSTVVAAGDLDGDGRHDLVGRTDSSGRLTAFLGTGRGGFSRQVLGAGWNTYDRVTGLGDVDGDGYGDLLGVDAQGRAFVHRGALSSGGGTGQGRVAVLPRQQLAEGLSALSGVAGVGDVNRDGRAELLLRRQGGATVLHGVEPDLTLGPAIGPVTGAEGLGSLSGGVDLTGDDWPDLLARSGGQVVVVPHKGTTEVLEPIVTDVDLSGANRLMTAGDMNGDGHGDVVVRQGKGVLNLYRGDGAGGFAAKARIGTGFSNVQGLRAVGDVTGDDKPDLLGTRGGRALVWPGRGAAELGEPVAAPAALVAYFRPEVNAGTSWDWATTVSDLRLVGAPDLVVGDRESRLLWSRNRRNDGTYETRRLLTRWDGAWNLMG